MLLYIHVPFCRRKCRYCAFYSNPLARSGDEMAVYLSALYAELGQWGRRLGRVPVESVFFGGGTPSLLDPDQLAGVLDCVGRTFEVLPGAEISTEANPHSPGIRRKRQAGSWRRASTGFRSACSRCMTGCWRRLGRLHRADAAREAFRAIREAGCANLSLDLMWGLPGQTLEQWLDDARAAIALGPEHVSAYGLTLGAGDASRGVLRGLRMPPSEDVQCAMYLEGIRLFEEAGLRRITRCPTLPGMVSGAATIWGTGKAGTIWGSALRRHPRSAGSAGPIRRGKAGWSRCGKGAAALSGNRWIGQRGRWSS